MSRVSTSKLLAGLQRLFFISFTISSKKCSYHLLCNAEKLKLWRLIHCSFLSFPELQVVEGEETVVVEGEEMVEVGEMAVMEEAKEGVEVSSHLMSTFTTTTQTPQD